MHKIGGTAIQNLVKYFDEQWFKNGHNGCYEAYTPSLQSTSNALEPIHAKIKSSLSPKRLGLIPFLNECQGSIFLKMDY